MTRLQWTRVRFVDAFERVELKRFPGRRYLLLPWPGRTRNHRPVLCDALGDFAVSDLHGESLVRIIDTRNRPLPVLP